MPVVSRTAETNAVSTYFVSKLAGPRIGKVRVSKGEELRMTEYQARGLLASGSLVTSKDLVDDPWGEVAAAAKAQAEADKAVAEQKARDAQAAAEAEAAQKAAEAEAAAEAARKAAPDADHGDGATGEHAEGDHHDDTHA